MSNFFEDIFIRDNLAEKVKEARENNDLKKQKILTGYTRLFSILHNIFFVMKECEDIEEFNDLFRFYSYVSQIFCRYLENYIEGKDIDLYKIRIILDSINYGYIFSGSGGCVEEEDKTYLFLSKCRKKEEELIENLTIPTPITLTEEWSRDLRNKNRRLNLNLTSE